MQPENFRFGGGASETILHPIVLLAMLIAIALIFLLPRKFVIWPVLCATFLIPLGQEILIAGLHFFVFRIIVLTVALRMLGSMVSSPEGIFGDRLGTFDAIFLLWAVFRALAGVLVFSFHPGAMVYQAGFLLDALGGYFVLRYLICDDEDIYRALRSHDPGAVRLDTSLDTEYVVRMDGSAMLHDARGQSLSRQGASQRA